MNYRRWSHPPLQGERQYKRSHKETVDIKDLDETTTTEEVVQEITSVVGPGIVTTENIRLRASYSSPQIASVLLPIGATRTLIKARKLRIGWLNCRVRLRETVTRCFKCHKIGTWHEIVRAQLTDRPCASGVERRVTRQ